MLAVALEQSDQVRILTIRTAGSHRATIPCEEAYEWFLLETKATAAKRANVVKNSRQRTQDKPDTLKTLSASRSCPTYCSQHSKVRDSTTPLNGYWDNLS